MSDPGLTTEVEAARPHRREEQGQRPLAAGRKEIDYIGDSHMHLQLDSIMQSKGWSAETTTIPKSYVDDMDST